MSYFEQFVDWPIPTKSDIKRFWKKVDIKGEDECWLYTEGQDSSGYGNFYYQDRQIGAHKFALMLKLGRSLLKRALHSCDTPLCCNGKHLKEGTASKNTQESYDRGRKAPADLNLGSRNGMSKLTEAKVREIKIRVRINGEDRKTVAKDFGISYATVGDIAVGKTWAQVKI